LANLFASDGIREAIVDFFHRLHLHCGETVIVVTGGAEERGRVKSAFARVFDQAVSRSIKLVGKRQLPLPESWRALYQRRRVEAVDVFVSLVLLLTAVFT
jgi:hypothetical protein